MDNLLYKFSLVAINNQILLQSYDEKEKLKLEVKSKWNRIFLNYLNNVFQLAVEEQEKKLKEFVTPDVAFLFCVKIDEVKDMQFPKDCSNLNDFYFNIYIVNNKKKDHNKLSYCDEDLHVNRNSCIRRSLTEKCEVINYHRTSVYRKNQKPVDEEFQFQLHDINSTQDLVIECYSYNEDDYNQKFVFKKAWRSLKQFLDNKRFCKEFIGQVKLPIKSLKDSDDLWFNLLCKHNDISHSIRAKVKLRITFKFENEKMHRNSSFNLLSSAASAKAIRPEDQFVAKSATGNNYLAREYHRLCQIVYDYEKKQQNKQNPNEKWNGMITELSIAFLKRFCDTFFIPNFAKELIELTTFVEKVRSDEVNTTGEYELITRRFTSFLAKYEKNLSMAKEVFEGADEDVNLLKACAVDLITNYFSRFSNTFRTFPIFSSPHQPNLQLLVDTFTSFHRLFVHISKAKAEELKNLFVEKLTNKVWDDVNFFINDVVKFEEANESDDSRSLKWISNLSSTIQNLNEYINDSNFKKNLLSDHFNYQKSVSLRISIALCNPIRLAIKLLNDYQKIYRQFLPNMLESSKVSCELYLSCTDLIKLLKMHVPDRELFKFKLNNYSDWFQEKEMFTFWLETYDIILRHYFNNAIFSENFGPAAEHVTYSDTAVVLANNLLNMLSEWNRINFQNLELKCVGIGSMSEIITTYCRRYAIDIRETLEKANYFFESGELSIQSFMTSLNKISIYVNNIRFIKKQVLDDLVNLLKLNETIKNCERYSENDNLIDVIKSAVYKSIEEALKDLNTITTTIINEINNRLKKQVETLVFNLIEYNEATEFLNFIDNGLKFLVKHFSDHSSKIIKNLRSNIIRLLVRYLPEKKVWKAYVHIVQFLNQIDLIYYDYGYPPIIEDQTNDPTLVKDPPELTEEINKLIEKLYVYSKPTSSLILDYLQYVNQIDHLVQSFGTTYSVFYYKLAFEESNDGQININLKIISCNNVKVDRFKTSDAYILVELMPYSLFDGQNKKMSQIVKKSENLFLNESFEFKNLSLDSFQTAGATLRLSLWEKDKNGLCTCLGECFHPLEHIEMMKPHHKTLNDMPAVKKILGRTPKENLECLEELERRVEFDNEAREFKRSREMKVQCIEVKSPGCGISYEATLNKVNDLLDCVKCFPVNELLTFMRKKVE